MAPEKSNQKLNHSTELIDSLTKKSGFTIVDGVYSREIKGQNFTFKNITDYKDFQDTIPVQKAAFSIEHDIDICPADMLATLKAVGGMVIAGYDPEQKPTSFIYLWPTKESGVYLLDMIGVLEKDQDKGVGNETVKVLMIEAAKRGDISEIRLTYDPLKVRNANLYIKKMGGRVVALKHNPYGEALAGDRFVISWDLSNPTSVLDHLNNPPEVSLESIGFYDLPQVRGNSFPESDLLVLPAPSVNEFTENENGDASPLYDLPVSRSQFVDLYRKVGDNYINEKGYTIKTFISHINNQKVRENYYLLNKVN